MLIDCFAIIVRFQNMKKQGNIAKNDVALFVIRLFSIHFRAVKPKL